MNIQLHAVDPVTVNITNRELDGKEDVSWFEFITIGAHFGDSER